MRRAESAAPSQWLLRTRVPTSPSPICRTSRARDVAREIEAVGRRAAVFRTDIAEASSVRALGPAARDALGRLDVWVNNAGADILTGAAASLDPVEKLDLLLAVDLRGTMLASWAAADMLGAQDEGGVIINMSWDHVFTGMAGRNPEPFAAAKGAVLAFSKSLARTVAPRVRVNVIAPGWIDTSFAATLPESSAPRDRRIGAARAVGHAGRRRRCGGVPGIARGSVSHWPDDSRWRWCSYVKCRLRIGGCHVMPQKESTYNEAQIAERAVLSGVYSKTAGFAVSTRPTDGPRRSCSNAIGYLAEAAYHHPDLTVTWARVTVKLMTHSAGGITDKDFELARRIEDAVLWRPPEGARSKARRTSSCSGDPR